MSYYHSLKHCFFWCPGLQRLLICNLRRVTPFPPTFYLDSGQSYSSAGSELGRYSSAGSVSDSSVGAVRNSSAGSTSGYSLLGISGRDDQTSEGQFLSL